MKKLHTLSVIVISLFLLGACNKPVEKKQEQEKKQERVHRKNSCGCGN